MYLFYKFNISNKGGFGFYLLLFYISGSSAQKGPISTPIRLTRPWSPSFASLSLPSSSAMGPDPSGDLFPGVRQR